jgi:hypothetical protein
VLYREGQRRSETGLRLLRGRAGPTIRSQVAHQRRGAADRSEHRQAAGAVAVGLSGATAYNFQRERFTQMGQLLNDSVLIIGFLAIVP